MGENYNVLGLNYGGHDTSACLMKDGKLIVACEEERYSKQKHTRDFPKNATNDCLKKANISILDVDEITLSYDPFDWMKGSSILACVMFGPTRESGLSPDPIHSLEPVS